MYNPCRSREAGDGGKVNGFSRPWNPLQMLSWVLFLVLVVGFYYCVFTVNFESAALRWVVACVHCFFVMTTLLFAISTSATNPVDGVEYDWQDGEDLGYCHLCKKATAKDTKHCRICDKCVLGFDHHCLWINNCVGKRNYKSFIWMLLSALVMVVIDCIIVSFSLSMETGADKDEPKIVLLSVYLAVVIVVLGQVAYLLGFHLYLIYSGQTTYSHLVNKAKKSRETKQKTWTPCIFKKFQVFEQPGKNARVLNSDENQTNESSEDVSQRQVQLL